MFPAAFINDTLYALNAEYQGPGVWLMSINRKSPEWSNNTGILIYLTTMQIPIWKYMPMRAVLLCVMAGKRRLTLWIQTLNYKKH